MSSFSALQRRVILETVSNLQSLLLLQVLIGISQTVNSSVSSSRALARTLILSGQQRLHDLLSNTPRIKLPLERLLELCKTGEACDAQRSPEKAAAQALIELCLGLMLQWMAGHTHPRYVAVTACARQSIPSLSFPFYPSRPQRVRSSPYVPLT